MRGMAWVNGGAGTATATEKTSGGITFWRVARWLFLLALIAVIVLMFRRPTPPPSVAGRTPEQRAADASSFRSKLDGLERAHNEGMPGVPAHFSEEELNGYIAHSVAELGNGAAQTAQPSAAVPSNAEAQAAAAALPTAPA